MANSDNSRPRLIGAGALVMGALLLAAWRSKPDEASFRRHMIREVRREAQNPVEEWGNAAAIELLLKTTDWEYTDYGTACVVRFPDQGRMYFGVGGTWHRLR